MNTSAHRVVQRPPRPLVLAQRQQQGGLLGHKPMSAAKADASMKELVGLIANSPTPIQLDQQTADILARVLAKHGRE